MWVRIDWVLGAFLISHIKDACTQVLNNFHCNAWRHESESVKIINLDVCKCLILSRASIIAVKREAELCNLLEIVSNGKTVVKATELGACVLR